VNNREKFDQQFFAMTQTEQLQCLRAEINALQRLHVSHVRNTNTLNAGLLGLLEVLAKNGELTELELHSIQAAISEASNETAADLPMEDYL
tara:strand:+ start:209 stop:481 length:273 start_codon:yes stop_codon:yes gene_type:complete